MILNDQKKMLDGRFNIGMLNADKYEELRMDILTISSKLCISDLDLEIQMSDDLLLVAPQLGKLDQ